MSVPPELDQLRGATPQCAGVALFQGAPLTVIASSGEAALAGWSSWEDVAEIAPSLLEEGPSAVSEVLLRLPEAMLLLSAQPGGVVAVVMALTKAGAGVALVQARVTASKVSG
ncbi:MAG: hypothetical protein R3B48_25405 [Kofleriaceae bacterium]